MRVYGIPFSFALFAAFMCATFFGVERTAVDIVKHLG